MRKDWVEIELGKVCDFIGGGTPSKKEPSYWNGNIPWASILISKVWNFANVLRDDGVGYGDYLEQITYLLFSKMADEMFRPPYNNREQKDFLKNNHMHSDNKNRRSYLALLFGAGDVSR